MTAMLATCDDLVMPVMMLVAVVVVMAMLVVVFLDFYRQ